MFSKNGNGTLNNPAAHSSSQNETSAQLRMVYLGIDIPLVLIALTLMLFGLIMVFSASTDYSLVWNENMYQVISRQIQAVLLAIAAATFLVFVDYHHWHKFILYGMATVIVLLLAVLIIDEQIHGARRGLLEGSFQPSEFAKFIMVIYLGVWLNAKKDTLKDITFGLLPLGMILGMMSALILMQPDFSAVLTLFIIGGTMFFLAGGDLKQIGILFVIIFIFGFLIVVFTDTGRTRVMGFISGLLDPRLAPYQVKRSLEAFYHGGWFGVGLGKGVVKNTGLPIPQTDSIFAVVGEELGFVGSAILVLLYTGLLWRGLGIARRAPDQLGSLLAAGMSLWLVMEAFINMAGMVNLLPFTGNALPFMSAGGSNLVVSLCSIGVLINVSRLASGQKENDGGQFAQFVNLRRGDRRRSVSRPRRPASVAEQNQWRTPNP